jgi:N-acetylglutamate synthase-like GNAT family acetyltransferase
MWTAPPHRGCGVGRHLVGAVLDRAGQSGAREVELWVTEGKVAVLALYQSTGFTLTGEPAASSLGSLPHRLAHDATPATDVPSDMNAARPVPRRR